MIDKTMAIGDVVAIYPKTIKVFEQCGLGCAGCRAALFETIEQGAAVHGVDEGILLELLNRAVKKAK